jgi:hypothetical protein
VWFFSEGDHAHESLVGRYQKAVEQGRKVVQLNPAFFATYKPYLAALGYLGREQEI